MASKAPKAPVYRRRHDRRAWLPGHDRRRQQPAPTVTALLTVIPSLPRAELSRLVHRMIDRMDDIDGNPDQEDDGADQCLAGDDGCGAIIIDGRTYWGSDVEPLSDL